MSTVQGAAPGSAPLLHLTSALVSQHPWSWEKQQQASTTIAAMAAALQQQHLHLHAGRRQRTPPFCPAAQCCRRRRCAAPPPRSVGTTQQQQQDAQDVLAQLLDEVQGAERGAASSAAQTASILAKVAALKSAQAGATTTAPGQLSATWKLLWCGRAVMGDLGCRQVACPQSARPASNGACIGVQDDRERDTVHLPECTAVWDARGRCVPGATAASA